jgi:hypothetical protein
MDSEEKRESFYYRIIGWPEGWSYMRDRVYAECTGWSGISKHNIPQIQKALERQSEQILD